MAAVGSSRVSTPEDEQRSLVSALQSVKLDVDYWLEALKSTCGVTEYDQLRFIEITAFEALEACARHDWEKAALRELTGIEKSYDKLNAERKQEAERQKQEVQTLLDDLSAMDDSGRSKTDDMVKEKEDRLRDVLNISKDDWVKANGDVTVNDLIDKFKSHLADLDHVDSNRKDLTPSELLERASGGIALKGILVTSDIRDCTTLRRRVLKIPRTVRLKASIAKQKDDVIEFTSRLQADLFQKSLDTMGHTAATSEKGGRLGFEAKFGFSEKQVEEETKEGDVHEKEVYLFREMYSFVPTAVCELNPLTLRLSDSVVAEIKKIECLLETTEQEEVLTEKCEEFFNRFGSHVNVGIIQFGGMYEWIATYSSTSHSNQETAKSLVQDALNGLVSMSFSGEGMTTGTSVTGDQVKNHSGATASHDNTELSKVSMHVSKKGGPQEVHALPLWKMGLIKCNDTWAIIDRGNDFSRDFIGIWQLLHNHTAEFRNTTKLADVLQHTWWLMSGMPPSCLPESDKVLVAIESMHELLEQIKNWVQDPELYRNAIEYLQKLLNQVEQVCSDTRDCKYWVEVLQRDQPFSDFLLQIADLRNDYSPLHVPHIQYLLRKLVSLAGEHDFPHKNDILEWVDITEFEEYLPGILKSGPIEDIPSLLSSIHVALLPAIQIGIAKARAAGRSHDAVDIQATVDLALAVDHLRTQLENAGKQYELFLLLSTLRDLQYNPSRKSFDVLLTEKSLKNFVEKFGQVWREFLTYQNSGSLKLQAFLLHCLVTRLLLIDDPRTREEEFLEAMHSIEDILTSELNLLLAPFLSSATRNWERLAEDLVELKKGNQSVLRGNEVVIGDIQEITSGGMMDSMYTSLYTDGPTDSLDGSSYPARLLHRLGLNDFYPAKISLRHVMKIGKMLDVENCPLAEMPWLILQKLIMLDFKGRDGYLGKVPPRAQRQTSDNPEEDEEDTFSTIEDILSGFDEDEDESEPITLNALDVFLCIYSCCDLMLKQTLTQKMFMCRLAVPIIYPNLLDKSLVFSLWALRSIIVEWRNEDQVAVETSVVTQPANIVCFIELGKPACSKSILMNSVMSDQAHHTFWNRDCPQGHREMHVASGMVETQWYLPSGKDTDHMKNVTMFLNLRGDACQYKTQLDLLQEISNVMVCCIEVTDLENADVRETMKAIHCSKTKVILLLVTKEAASLNPQTLRKQLEQYISFVGKKNMTNAKQVSGFRGTREKNTDDLKHELRDAIGKFVADEQGMPIEEVSVVADRAGFGIDEYDDACWRGKQLALRVVSCLEGMSTNECKAEMLPLQGENWKEWSRLLRNKQQSGRKDLRSNVIYEMSVIQQNMTQLRKSQLQVCNNLSPLVKTFIRNLIKVIDSPEKVNYYLQWIKLQLDDKSRKTLPGLHTKYHQKWMAYKVARDEGSHQMESMKKELEAAEAWLAGASLGLEHLLREVAQLYEAAIESELELKESTKSSFERLPEIAAKLLLNGQPLEVMDGDASNVPLTWVKSVLASIIRLVGDKKVFIVSVLGIQSSGKSTLLNTMFGLQFAVSAGRCTRGVYMQLIEVDKKSAQLPYDYVLVIDTEGLRAPELGQLKHSHDNELATLVIGLGDVTIMNVKGENVAEMADVLQIAVHAFLRMKIINKNFQVHRTCVFLHQNVPAVNAKEKMQHGCQKLQENLDEMTMEACAIENIADIHTFNQVIDFDSQKNVWYFSDLWHGDPPMAPANPGYSERVQEVKECLLNDLSRKQQIFLSFSDLMLRINDLWEGVLSDDFVFSFRNSLAAKAYNSLENTYFELSWSIESNIMEWVNHVAIVQLERCSSSEMLERCCAKLLLELEDELSTRQETARGQLERFFKTSNLRDILIQWQVEKLESLNIEAKSFLNRAKREILQRKDSLRIDLLQKVTQEKHEMEVMRKAKELADAMKGKSLSDDELHSKFESVWIQWLNQLASRDTITPTPVEVVVEQILWQRLAKDSAALRIELRQNPLSKPLLVYTLEHSIKVGNIKESHLSMRTSLGQNIMSFFSGKDPWFQCRHTAVQAINVILRKVDVYLKDLSKQDSRFQESYATYVIKSVMDGVQDHNQQYSKQYPFTLLPNLMVKLAVHVSRYAVGVFKKMQNDYEENHGVAKKLSAYKTTAWNLFRNTVNQNTKEVIAADLLYDRLEDLVKKTVKRRMTGDVMEEVVHYFGRKKHNLMLAILDDLALKGNFENYRSFLTNSKDYALRWLTTFTNDKFFSPGGTKPSKYADHARKHIHAIAQGIEKSVRNATDLVLKQGKPSIRVWAHRFHGTLVELPITEGDLRHMTEQNVADFHNLQRLLMERLLRMEEAILASFAAQTADTIRWMGTTPYRQIADKLWGCEAQCPFCSEPCQRTDPNHASNNDNHQCIQHRPSGVGGDRWDELHRKDQLVVESCNYQVQCKGLKFNCRDCNFECRKSEFCSTEGADWQYHSNIHYKTFLPHWDIAPSSSMDSSKYWMWFMVTYQNQLKNMYNAALPNIPESWTKITVQQAVDSLRVYNN